MALARLAPARRHNGGERRISESLLPTIDALVAVEVCMDSAWKLVQADAWIEQGIDQIHGQVEKDEEQ